MTFSTRRVQLIVSGLLVSFTLCSAQWQGKLFNYQLQTVFNIQTDVIPGVQVYFIDLFDTNAATVTAMNAAGLVPVCYFSTQYEDWRPDAARFPAAALGNALDGWAGERWVDVRDATVRSIMTDRIALCKQKGFVAVDPDNTDGYQAASGTGFGTTEADTLDFLTFLSNTARAAGLGIGLKNTLALIFADVGLWDFAVNEQCSEYNECNYYTPFQAANKTVFNIEYQNNNATFQNTICPYTHSFGLTSIRKEIALNARPWDACYAYLPTSPPPSSPPVTPSPTPPPVNPPPPPAVGPNIPALKSCSQGLAIPSYFYPGSYFAQAKAAKAKIMIINPASGPGTAVDANYVNTVTDMRAAGTTILGYVYTQYGNRDPALVRQDIDKYLTWYGVQGIFLDEGSNLCTAVPYYAALVEYIKAALPSAVTALNWGVDGPECFFTTPNPVDIVLNYENTYADYVTWAGPSAWVNKYNASRFWQLVHSTPSIPEAFWRSITLSKSRNAGWLYVTDDVMNNPWDTLPQGGLWSLQTSMLQSSQQVSVQGPYVAPCFTASCVWMRVKGAARVVVANPSSGPGTRKDAAWARLADEMRAAGTLALGYVYTSTGSRAAATVKSQISKYYQWYPSLAGIFIDQVSTSCNKLAYYQDLVAYIRGLKGANAVIVFNWGSAGNECYLSSTNPPDIVGTFEGSATAYSSYAPSSWTLQYPAYRFLNNVFSAPTAGTGFSAVVTSTATKRAGYSYVNTGSSWTTIPSTTLFPVETGLVANATLC